MNKAHWITVAVAASLGYTAGFASDGLVAATTIPHNVSTVQQLELPIANAAIQNIRDKVDAALCDQAATALSLDLADCSDLNVQSLSVSWRDAEGVARVSSRFVFPGNLTLTTP